MKKYPVFIISILLTLTSCVTILQSLVTRANILSDNRIEGAWIDSEAKNIVVQRLLNSRYNKIFAEAKSDHHEYSKSDSVFYTKHYVISFREKNLDYTWIAGMVKIKDQYYLNLKPEECLNNNGKEVGISGETTSSIAKLTWKNENTLVLNFLNGDHVKEIILDGKAQIKYEYDPLFETFVITASSGELTLFLERYGNNGNLFKGGNVITLKRKN